MPSQKNDEPELKRPKANKNIRTECQMAWNKKIQIINGNKLSIKHNKPISSHFKNWPKESNLFLRIDLKFHGQKEN